MSLDNVNQNQSIAAIAQLLSQPVYSENESAQNGHTQMLTNPLNGDSITHNSAVRTGHSGTQSSYAATVNGLTTAKYSNGTISETNKSGAGLIAENGTLYGTDGTGARKELGSVNDPKAWMKGLSQHFGNARSIENMMQAMRPGGLLNVDGVKPIVNSGLHSGSGTQRNAAGSGISQADNLMDALNELLSHQQGSNSNASEATGLLDTSVADDAQNNATGQLDKSVADDAQNNATGRLDTSVADDAQSKAVGRLDKFVADAAQNNAVGRLDTSVADDAQNKAVGRLDKSAADDAQNNAVGRLDTSVANKAQLRQTVTDNLAADIGNYLKAAQSPQAHTAKGQQALQPLVQSIQHGLQQLQQMQ